MNILVNHQDIENIVSAIQYKTANNQTIFFSNISNLINQLEIPERISKKDEIIAGTLSNYSGPNLKIGAYAFANCSNLSEVSFPLCSIIGSSAFMSCSNLTTISFPAVRKIEGYAFQSCSKLTTVDFPECDEIGGNAFYYCKSLATINFPKCTSISGTAFRGCSSLTKAVFPACSVIYDWAFQDCINLTMASFPNCLSIDQSAFYSCTKLFSFYLMGSNFCSLYNSSVFKSTPMDGTVAGGFGSIYVPASLLTTYKTAENWSYYSSRFVGV